MKKKNTPSVSSLPQFDENPFIEEALANIEEKTTTRRQYVRGSRGVDNIVSNSEGEVVGHTRFVRYVEVDEEKFAKIYLSEFTAFWELSKTAIRVFTYVLQELLPNKDVVYIEVQGVMKLTGYKEEKSVYKGIAELVDAGIIARSKNHVKYFINPLIFFNGNRVTYATTYIKKKELSKKKADPNQLSMKFNSGVDPGSLINYLQAEENRDDNFALTSIALLLSFSLSCLNHALL